jgi:tetratricopeptide (TPR) repeat protein
VKNPQEALKYINKCIELEPEKVGYYHWRANIYRNLGNLQQALNDYNRYIKHSGKKSFGSFDNPYANRAGVNERIGNFQQAIIDYTKAIEDNPDYPYHYRRRANVYLFNLKDYTKAIEDYDKATELKPDNGSVYGLRGLAYERLGNNDQAINDFLTAARLGDKTSQDYLRQKGYQ